MTSRKAISLLVGFSLVLLMSTSAIAADNELYGTWRLLSFTRTVVATGETSDVFGKSPHGFISYGRDGRMFFLVVKDNRPKPSDMAWMTDQERVELFKSMFAYSGTYTYDGRTIKLHIDISWNENWTGTELVWKVKLDGNKLTLSTIPHSSGLDSKVVSAALTWERIE
jgi:hypothetical protein